MGREQNLKTIEEALKSNYLPVWNNLLGIEPTPLLSKIISTHTLRGERDTIFATASIIFFTFQLTRSVGSVTKKRITELGQAIISTHTLRGERDTYTI